MENLNAFDPRIESHRPITSDDVSGLIRNIQLINEELALFKSIESLSITSKENYKHNLIENIKYKVLHQNKNTSEDELVQIFIQKLNISAQVIANIEKATRGQSRESLWYKVGSGRLTASKHHDIYTKTNSVIKASGPIKPETTSIVAKVIYNDGKISTPRFFMKRKCQNTEHSRQKNVVHF